MKHFNTITRKPAQAMSVVEFDGLVGVFGRALAALSSTLNFVLGTFGIPVIVQHQKDTGKP